MFDAVVRTTNVNDHAAVVPDEYAFVGMPLFALHISRAAAKQDSCLLNETLHRQAAGEPNFRR
jgi:hypothetical protein